MRILTRLFTLTICFVIAFTISAQTGWNWGDQEETAKEKQVLYKDNYKAKNYQVAFEPLNWLVENTPDLHVSIYQDGAKIYEALAKEEADATKKEELIQTGLTLFDKRIQYFGKEAEVSERKAGFAYTFYNKERSKYSLLYELFSKAFSLRGIKMNRGYLVAYMNCVYKHRFAGGDLSDEQVIDIYFSITDALGEQRKNADDATKEKIDKSLDTVDKLLLATKVDISCDFVEEQLGPKLDTEEDNLNMAKKIFKLMLDGKCLERELALRTAEIIQEREPTYAVAKLIAQKNAQNDNDETAIKFFEQAASLTDNSTEKAEAYLSIAKIQNGNGQKANARNSARRALAFDPQFTDAYKLIGDLYMTSFEICKGEKSQVLDRAIFIAAYNEYRKAGYQKGMTNAQNQFPSIENIFSEGYEEGQSITIGCWINTTVSLERRPNN